MTTNELIRALRDKPSRDNRALLDAAADALERTQWISVKERLPNPSEGDWVLGVVYGKISEYIEYRGAVVTVAHDPCSGFYLEEDPDARIRVTHWMPMPKPPEGGAQDAEV